MRYTDRDALFWGRVWRAADLSCLYRKHAARWAESGSVDFAAELEHAADALDALWDRQMRAYHDRGA